MYHLAANVSGHPPQALWWVKDTAILPEPLCRLLDQAGWEYKRTDHPNNLPGNLDSTTLDMVLDVSHDTRIAEHFAQLSQQRPVSERPLLVVVGDYLNPDDEYSSADLIITPHPSSIEAQAFNTLLRIRADNQHLRNRLNLHAETEKGIEQLKNAIVRNVAHELRTPLLQIKGAITLLRDDRQDQFERLIDLAQVATSRLELSVHNITLLNKLINDSLEQPEFAAFQPAEAAESAVRQIRRMWQHRDGIQHLQVTIQPGLTGVMGDRHLITIALQQLLDNAHKFGEHRPIDLLVQPVEEGVRFQICDQGIGIDSDQHERIFDWFYQVDGSSTRSYGGIGAGLAIVSFILARHQVEITVDSAIGKGSCFGFTLPLAGV